MGCSDIKILVDSNKLIITFIEWSITNKSQLLKLYPYIYNVKKKNQKQTINKLRVLNTTSKFRHHILIFRMKNNISVSRLSVHYMQGNLGKKN